MAQAEEATNITVSRLFEELGLSRSCLEERLVCTVAEHKNPQDPARRPADHGAFVAAIEIRRSSAVAAPQAETTITLARLFEESS